MNPARRQSLLFAGAMGTMALVGVVLTPRRRLGLPVKVDLGKAFPSQFESWRTSGVMNAFVRPPDQPLYRIYDQVLERTYVNPEGRHIMLSAAYGGAQVDGLELHRPEICYRNGGFAVRGARPDEVRVDRMRLPVNRVLAELPGRPEAITYWTVLGGNLTNDANTFRLVSLSYAVRRIVVDGLVVRISSIDPRSGRAFALHDHFISALMVGLPGDVREFIFGVSNGIEAG